MPVVDNVKIQLNLDSIARRQGIRDITKARPEVLKHIEDAVNYILVEKLISAMFIYEIYPVQYSNNAVKIEDQGVQFEGKALKIMSTAKEIAVVVCTAGWKIDDLIREKLRNKETYKAILFDGIGSAVVDGVSQEACRMIADYARDKGFQSSSPVSPGMPGMDIAELRKIFKLVNAQKIGVTLTEAGVLRPAKSVGMLIGIGENMKQFSQEQMCKICPINSSCAHRVVNGWSNAV